MSGESNSTLHFDMQGVIDPKPANGTVKNNSNDNPNRSNTEPKPNPRAEKHGALFLREPLGFRRLTRRVPGACSVRGALPRH